MLELLRQVLVRVLLPKLFGSEAALASKVLIIDVPFVCKLCSNPWIVFNFGDQHKHSECKDVCILSLVLNLLVKNFWSHIHLGADKGAHKPASFTAMKLFSEAKIDDFNFAVLSDHDVIKLNISVREFRLVNLVDSIRYLLEDKSVEAIVLITHLVCELKHLCRPEEFHNNKDADDLLSI